MYHPSKTIWEAQLWYLRQTDLLKMIFSLTICNFLLAASYGEHDIQQCDLCIKSSLKVELLIVAYKLQFQEKFSQVQNKITENSSSQCSVRTAVKLFHPHDPFLRTRLFQRLLQRPPTYRWATSFGVTVTFGAQHMQEGKKKKYYFWGAVIFRRGWVGGIHFGILWLTFCTLLP